MPDLRESYEHMFSEPVRSKAKKVTRVRQDDREIWWVGSINSPKEYRVQVLNDTYITCSCTHGLNSNGIARCYHVAAVMKTTLEEEQG